MNKSENIGNLAKALSAVQAELKPAVKDSQNPFFRSTYADLNSVWDSCRVLLSNNNLAVSQLNQVTDLGVIVETVLMHESGEWISGEILLPLTKQDAQGVGSAMTYGRRYGLAAIIGIVADDDDDGNAASQQRAAQKPVTKPQPKEVKPIGDRIKNVEKAIRDLGGKIEPRKQNETEQAYFESLVEQWNILSEKTGK